MARFLYSDPSITFTTPNLSISIDSITGLVTCTYGTSMSFFVSNVASYSTNTTVTLNQNTVIINSANATITLPSSPPNGFVYTFRNTTTGNPTLSASPNLIRNVGSASGTFSYSMVVNGSNVFAYYNGTWYGI